MLSALLTASIVFVLAWFGLMLVERLIHKLTHNANRSYRWGVWVFAGLLAVYAFLTSLGR